MKFKSLIAAVAVGLGLIPALLADLPATITRRGDIKNAESVFENTHAGTVAFLGGSITEGKGYSTAVMKYLKAKYPQCAFTEINAGISSTCSDTGAFRVQEDILSKRKVDLFFVEFAVNDDQDGHFSEEHARRGMEGIVRQVRETYPACDIVMIHFVNPGELATIQAGGTPTPYAAHESVAARYDVPTVNIGAELARLIAAGTWTWEKYGVDGNGHPTTEGGQMAADKICELLTAEWTGGVRENPVNHTMPEKLDSMCYSEGGHIPLENAVLGTGWNLSLPNWASIEGNKRDRYTADPILWSETPGSEFTLTFTGTAVGAFVTSYCWDVGALDVSVDGGAFVTRRMISTWSYSLHYPMTVMLVDDLAYGAHTLTVRLVEDHKDAYGIEQDNRAGGRVARIHALCVNGVVPSNGERVNMGFYGNTAEASKSESVEPTEPTPNSWTTLASITKTSWTAGEDDPGVVTPPVAQYNDNLKAATISKDGAPATTSVSFTISDPDPGYDPYVPGNNTLQFLDATKLMNFVATKDYTVAGIIFANGTQTRISGGHTITVNSSNDNLLDVANYNRIFLGNTELTVTGAGTAVTVNPKGRLGQSSNMSITAQDGASFANTKWNFSDNGGYTLVATGEGSQLAMTLQSDNTWYAIDSGYRFEASDGATLKITRGNYSLDFGKNANHGLVVTADGGTATLTGVQVTKGAPTVTLAGSGTAAFDTFTPAGGTLTLAPDANWSVTTPHLTTTGSLTLNANMTYKVDVSNWTQAGTKTLVVAQATGSLAFTSKNVEVVGTDKELCTQASLSQSGKQVLLTLTMQTVQNEWTTPAAIDKPQWILDEGEEPGKITIPVAKYYDNSKTATISKNGGTATAWDGLVPTTAGSYRITWTVPTVGLYLGNSTAIEFTILETRPKYVKVGMDWTWEPWQDLSSFTRSASTTIGWRAEGTDTVDSTHVVSADCDYIVPNGANLSTGGGSGEDMRFAGHKLILETDGKLVAFRDGHAQTVTVNHLVAQGGELAGRRSDSQFKTFAGNFDLSEGDLGISCDEGMKIKVAATVTGDHDIFLVGSNNNNAPYQLQFTGKMSEWTGTIKKPRDTWYNGSAYQLTVSGEFGGSFTSIPKVDAGTDSYAAFNYDNLVDGATKGLKIKLEDGEVDATVKNNVVLYSSTADFTKKSLPIMTFPKEANVRAEEFKVRYAETAVGDKTQFTHLWLRPNADGTKTLVANSRGLMLIFGL